MAHVLKDTVKATIIELERIENTLADAKDLQRVLQERGRVVRQHLGEAEASLEQLKKKLSAVLDSEGGDK